MIKMIKKGEIVVKADDFGMLVEELYRAALRPKGPRYTQEWLDTKLREWWPKLDEYCQRQIMCAIEVAILLDEPPRSGREPLEYRTMWEKIVKDLRPARSPFTIKYCCDQCKVEDVKLWRQSNTFADYIKLQCASCLAPGEVVNEKGKFTDPSYGYETDQLKGCVPAIPVGDTYWGYTSVPSQDVEWWVALPTYKKS
ncbi:MAG TPA: hypothetical protein VM577_00730 [Anaerovoracaceae bacterium]|nr:hypothetical protein [Anaerovoracaceae bacterium]